VAFKNFWILFQFSKNCQRQQSTNLGHHAGTDVMIFKNIFAEKMAFFVQTTASFCKNCDHNIVFFRKTPIFSPKIVENRRKL
jgi:hypothetical protein